MKRIDFFLLAALFAVACTPAITIPGLAGGDIKDKKAFPLVFNLERFTTSSGNAQSDTVIVASAGGPSMFFSEDFIRTESQNNKNLLWVEALQFQAVYNEPFLLRDLTMDEVNYAVEHTVEILYQTIQYYKNKGKKVIVVGASYGALIVQKLLIEKGADAANAYAILVGRLRFKPNVLKSVSQAKIGKWYPDGHTYVEALPSSYDEFHERNRNRLLASVGDIDYIQSLDKVIPDDPDETRGNGAKFFYAFGEEDKNIGNLTRDELEFLKRKGFSLHYDEKTENNRGDHHTAVINGIKEAMKLGIIPAITPSR